MNQNDYVNLSLELHLFFDRIMKEHSFFLEVAFTEKNNDLKKIARRFQKEFAQILKRSIALSRGRLSKDFLSSNEIVTKNTLKAEAITSRLSGVMIDSNITTSELDLESGNREVSSELIKQISALNIETLSLVKGIIKFKNDILVRVLDCKMFTMNYPLLITHIMNEAKMYYSLLEKIENKNAFAEREIYEQEVFWNNIMMEHAQFIRGLLDPSENTLIETADGYAKNYKRIIESSNATIAQLTKDSLSETTRFRDFKIAGVEGILTCKIKSIIIPLLADHVLREANHFIRILKSIKLY